MLQVYGEPGVNKFKEIFTGANDISISFSHNNRNIFGSIIIGVCFYNISIVPESYLTVVEIHNSTITDISVLKNVCKLSLLNCNNINEIPILPDCKYLNLLKCHNMDIIKGKYERVCIEDCNNFYCDINTTRLFFNDMKGLILQNYNNVLALDITDCDISHIKTINSLEYLNTTNCKYLNSIDTMPNLTTFKRKNCYNLKNDNIGYLPVLESDDIKFLERNKYNMIIDIMDKKGIYGLFSEEISKKIAKFLC